jgi:hypothetical protein
MGKLRARAKVATERLYLMLAVDSKTVARTETAAPQTARQPLRRRLLCTATWAPVDCAPLDHRSGRSPERSGSLCRRYPKLSAHVVTVRAPSAQCAVSPCDSDRGQCRAEVRAWPEYAKCGSAFMSAEYLRPCRIWLRRPGKDRAMTPTVFRCDRCANPVGSSPKKGAA